MKNTFCDFRMPNEMNLRQKWDHILSNHRQTNAQMICAEHFNPNEIIIRKDRCILKPNAVPSIFISLNTHKTVSDSIVNIDFNADVAGVIDYVADVVDIVTTNASTNQADNYQILNDRCDELQRENLIKENQICQLSEVLEELKNQLKQSEKENLKNENKIQELSTELEALKNQLKQSQLAQFALNNNFIDAKVLFSECLKIKHCN